MTGAERGWLLLCADLGDGVKPLTPGQVKSLRKLFRQSAGTASDPGRELTVDDLMKLGCDKSGAERIFHLLHREESLNAYLRAAEDYGILPLTRVSPDYPAGLLRLGDRAPAVLLYRGNRNLLCRKAVCLTGSRMLSPDGAAFAERIGALAAAEGLILVSGNAKGADQIAQDACLQAGGSVVSVLPGPLWEQEPASDRQLLLCEDGWQLPFTSYRALSRNRLIYALAELALIAEVGLKGGTMRGASDAIRRRVVPVFVREDSSPGALALMQLGADPVPAALRSLNGLRPSRLTLWEYQQDPVPIKSGEKQ